MNPHADRRFEVETPFRIRPSDIDFAGHVSNAVYIRWLEDLQLHLLHTYCPLQELMQQHRLVPVLLRTSITYQHEIMLFDQPVGRMWMREMGPLRMTLEAQIEVAGRMAAQAEQILCFVSMDTRRPIKVPAGFRAQFQTYLLPGEQAHASGERAL